MKPEIAGKIKYGVWGLIVGAVIAMIIGFAWGGWTTSKTTQEMSDEAVLAPVGLNFSLKNKVAAKGNSYVGYLFQ